MTRALAGAAIYFAATFAAGFALGTVRTLLVAPALGETLAVLAEVPFMLAIAWIVCGKVIRLCGVGPGYEQRAAMGLAAFGLLVAAEFALGSYGFGMTLGELLQRYETLAGAFGLAAQMAFGAFPLFRR